MNRHDTSVVLYRLADFFSSSRFMAFVEKQPESFRGIFDERTFSKLVYDFNFQATQGTPKTEALQEFRDIGKRSSDMPIGLVAQAWAKEFAEINAKYFSDIKVRKSDQKFKVARGQDLLSAVMENFSYKTMRGVYRVVTDATPVYQNPDFYAVNTIDAFGTLVECLDTFKNGTGHAGYDSVLTSLYSIPDYFADRYLNDLMGVGKRIALAQGEKAFDVSADPEYCSAYVLTEEDTFTSQHELVFHVSAFRSRVTKGAEYLTAQKKAA